MLRRGFEAVVRVMQAKAPHAVMVLTGIFPRNDQMAVMATIDEINAQSGEDGGWEAGAVSECE